MEINQGNLTNKPEKKTSKLALLSFISAILGVICFFIGVPIDIIDIFFLFALVFLSLSLFLGTIALIIIKRNKEKLKGRRFADISLLVSVLFLIGMVWLILSVGLPFRSAYNAEIKTELHHEIKAEAEIYYMENNDTYTGFTTEDGLVPPECSGDAYTIQISPDGQKFLAYARLCRPKENTFWCIDSEGGAKEIVADSIPTDVYNCSLQKEAPPEDEIDDWETYRNEEYGFEVKYPQNYTISISGGHSPLAHPENLARISIIPEGMVPDINHPYIDIDIVDPKGFTSVGVDNYIAKTYEDRLSPLEESLLITNTESKIYKLKDQDFFFIFFRNDKYILSNNYIFNTGSPSKEFLTEILSTFGFIDPHTGKKQVNIIKLCESNLLEEELGEENVILLNFDDDNDKEILLGWPAIKAADPHFFYVLDKQGKSCSIVWQKSSYGDFKMKSVANLVVNDLDKDGVDEIIISGYNSGGTCTYGVNYNFIYSPKSNQLFWSENWGGYLVDNSKRTDVFCTEKIIEKGDIGCGGNDLINSICFSNNLKEDKNQVFKKYLDELLIK